MSHSTLSIVRMLTLILLLTGASIQSDAQCSGCTNTVSTNAAVTVSAGQVVCLTYAGTYTQTITFNGGTLCISPSTTVSSAITVNSGSTLNVYGTVAGSYTANGGTATVYSGGNLTPSSTTLNGGALTINSGGTANVGTVSVASSASITSNGSFTASSLTVNAATIALNGTNSITGSLTVNNNSTFTMKGPATIGGSFTANGGTTNFSGGITIGGSVDNNATINLAGNLSVGGTYNSNAGAVIKETQAGTSTLIASAITGYGSINGNSNTLLVSPAPSNCSGCLTNGASVMATPAISSFSATSACAGSFSSVTINGTGFSGATAVKFNGTAAASYTVVSSTKITATPATGTTTGTITVTNAAGTIGTSSSSFTVNAAPTAAITGTGVGCASVSLTATGGGTYAWSGGSATTSATNTFTTNATYTVTVTSSGCTATASKAVSVNANPTAAITGTATGCGSVSLTASGGTSYAWSGGSATTSAANTFTSSATYIVTVTNASSCSATASKVVTVNPVPAAAITGTGVGCGSVSLTATGGGTYAWSGGSATTSATNTFTSSATYTVTVTSSGCTATASQVVTVNANPTAAITGTAAACTSVSLTATGGTSYAWSGGLSTASAANTFTAGGTYVVTVTNASSCTATASSVVSVYTVPTIATWSNTPVCVGSTAMITATPSGATSYTYSWSGPSSYTSTSSSLNITDAITAYSGNYALTVTDNHSCTASTTVAMYVNPNCIDSTTVGANGGNSSDAPCTQILRFDHYDDVVASQAGGQFTTWKLSNGSILTMNVTRTAGGFMPFTSPSWSGAGFGQSGYTGLTGKPILYTTASGYSKVVFSNISMKDSNGVAINNFTLIGIDAESTDNSERDTLTTNGTAWFDYDTITPPSIGSVPSETGINTNTLVWAGTGSANARARLVSTNNPTTITFSTVAGGLQAFALGVANPIQAITATTICSNSSFNATPTNLPAGTTYTWSAPVVTPSGSLTGAVAQSTPIALVGQTLVNTTSAAATAVYTVVPSNNCSGLGYTVTVTVNPAPSATITSNAPLCTGGNLTATATTNYGGTLTYSWSGPASFTSTASTFTINGATVAKSGTYTLTITGSNSCTASIASNLSVVNCVNVSGYLFDDANGNGTMNGVEATSSNSQTMYTVLADTTGRVMSTSMVAANGSFSIPNVLPSTSGLTVRVSTINPAVGSSVSSITFPANWLPTYGQYGVNNGAGTGIYNNASQVIPVKTSTVDVTGMYIGYDRLQAPTSQAYTITHPALSSIKAISTAAGLGNISWTDPEDGANVGSFVVVSVTGMNGNVLFYDSNSNNTVEVSEIITGYRVIANFNTAKLKMKFTATGTSRASFTFAYMDLAGKVNPSPSTYSVNWTGGALPVTLEYFTADKKDEHSSLLRWATATEIDNDHFEIERSADATTWEAIGEVKGAGTTSAQQIYAYTDNAPVNGVNYYRLKQVDVDGHFVYTNVEEVSFDGIAAASTTMTMYPNPATAATPLTIQLSNTSAVISNVTVTNSIGQVVYSEVASSSNVLHLSGLNLPVGVYAVSVSSLGDAKPLTSLLVIK